MTASSATPSPSGGDAGPFASLSLPPPPHLRPCLQTLLRVLDNVLRSPDQPKLRRIRVTNPAFVKRAGRFDGATAFLREAGFEDDGPDHMRLGGAGDGGEGRDEEVLERLRRGRDALAAYGRERGAVPPGKPGGAPGGIARPAEVTAKAEPKTGVEKDAQAETATGAAGGAVGGTAKAAPDAERDAKAETATGASGGAKEGRAVGTAPTVPAVDKTAEAAKEAEQERAVAKARAKAEVCPRRFQHPRIQHVLKQFSHSFGLSRRRPARLRWSASGRGSLSRNVCWRKIERRPLRYVSDDFGTEYSTFLKQFSTLIGRPGGGPRASATTEEGARRARSGRGET